MSGQSSAADVTTFHVAFDKPLGNPAPLSCWKAACEFKELYTQTIVQDINDLPFFHHPYSSSLSLQSTFLPLTGNCAIAIGVEGKTCVGRAVLKTVIDHLYEQYLGNFMSPRIGGTAISTFLGCIKLGRIRLGLVISPYQSLSVVHRKTKEKGHKFCS